MAKLSGGLNFDISDGIEEEEEVQQVPIESTETIEEPVPQEQTKRTIGTPPLDSPGNMTEEELSLIHI